MGSSHSRQARETRNRGAIRKNLVGPRIRSLRRRSPGISQSALAERVQALGVDIDQTALSRIERGERQVTDLEIVAIARALGVRIVDLFEGNSSAGRRPIQ